MPDYLNIARRALERSANGPVQPATLESVVKGLAIELWSDTAGSLFIVADEIDARRLAEPRGATYTALELKRVLHINDPAIITEVHGWKRQFNGRIRQDFE